MGTKGPKGIKGKGKMEKKGKGTAKVAEQRGDRKKVGTHGSDG